MECLQCTGSEARDGLVSFRLRFYNDGIWKYLEAYLNKEYICLKYTTAQLYFISGRADLYWNLSSLQ